MINKIKTLILSLASLIAFASPALVPATASAQVTIQNSVCGGANALQLNADTGDCNAIGQGASSKLDTTIKKVINIFSVIVGVVAVIMIIVGGFRYIASGGAAEKVSGAKNTILYALVGLIIVALAQIIVKFVLGKASNA